MGVKLQSSSGGSVEIAAPVTASNYVLTAPAATDTLVGATSAQTLTNKTLTSPTINMGVKLQSSSGGSVEIAAPVTASNYTLTAPATSSTIDTLARTGNVLQVVSATYSSQATSTSSTWVDTGVSASITPSSATSKILVLVDQAVEAYASNVTGLGLRLMRDATAIKTTDSTQGGSVNAAVDIWSRAPLNHLDSPATTSAVTYKTQFRRSFQADGPYGNYTQVQRGGDPSTITLMEIAG